MTEASKCGDCPIATDRRRFLRDAGLTVIATLVASGLKPSSALAKLIAETRPVRSSGPMRAYSVPAADAVLIDVDNDVIIARSRKRVYAFSRRCPHKGTRLEWREDESRIFCPKHKARFDTGGAHVSGRHTRNLNRYALRLQGSEIVVDTGTVYRQDMNPQEWTSAVIALG
jgi:nitrite reductase/ring-hydroxylating ferredoxin subunit